MKPTRFQTDALVAQVATLMFKRQVRHARRSEDFAGALYTATLGDDGRHAIDLALEGLDEAELLALAGGPEFAAWFEGLDVLEQMRFARGEAPPWRPAEP